MAKFKRVNDQYTTQINAYCTATAQLYVGDVISFNSNTGEAVKLTDLASCVTAVGSGLQVYIIAQGDAVTEKTGTDYKTYTVSTLVDMTGHQTDGQEKIIVAYLVKDLTNIQF